MLIVGAGGLAAQIFPDIEAMHLKDVAFWSEYDTKYPFIKEKYPLVSTNEEVKHFFETVSRSFILCVGQPSIRKLLREKFTALGGNIVTYISPFSTVSPYCTIGTGTTILSNVIIEPGTVIGEACLFNKTSNIGHGCIINDYCELAPSVILTGEVEIGEYSYIGTGTIILPKAKVGSNVTIAAGAIVKKDIPDNALVSANESIVVKIKNPL